MQVGYSCAKHHNQQSAYLMRSNARPFPVLATKRLLLRAPLGEDATAFGNILSIPDVTRYSNWPEAPSKVQLERAMRWMRKAYASGKGCGSIIEERSSNTIAGAIRFNSFEIKWKCGEIGYELHPDFWGKGLMTEAVNAVAACGYQAFGLNRIEAWTLPAIRRRTGCWRNQDFDMKGRCDKEGGSREPTTISACLDDLRTMSRLDALKRVLITTKNHASSDRLCLGRYSSNPKHSVGKTG